MRKFGLNFLSVSLIIIGFLLTKTPTISSATSYSVGSRSYNSEDILRSDANIETLDCTGAKEKKSLLLWSIGSSKQKVKSFLFGTIHVSYNKVWDYVSKKVKEVFSLSESVVFELELQNPETIELLLQCKNLESDETLNDILPAFLFDRLKHYMRHFKYRILQWAYKTQRLSRTEAKREAKRIYNNIAGDWEIKRPVWLLFLLYQMSESSMVSGIISPNSSENEDEIRQNDDMTPMLDVFLAQKAQELGKSLHSIETPEEQCNPLLSIDQDQVIFAINYTLSYLEWISAQTKEKMIDNSLQTEPHRSGLTELIEHYRCGSLESSVFSSKRFVKTGFSISPELDLRAKEIDNLLVDDIILKRNIRMAKRADSLLKNSPTTTFFFAIGAGHFLGDKSLLKLLENYGYSITSVRETDNILADLRNNSHIPTKFNELWVRDEMPSIKQTIKEKLFPTVQLPTNKLQQKLIPFRMEIFENDQNNILTEDTNLQISISLYEIPAANSPTGNLKYLDKNSSLALVTSANIYLYYLPYLVFFLSVWVSK